MVENVIPQLGVHKVIVLKGTATGKAVLILQVGVPGKVVGKLPGERKSPGIGGNPGLRTGDKSRFQYRRIQAGPVSAVNKGCGKFFIIEKQVFQTKGKRTQVGGDERTDFKVFERAVSATEK